MTEYMKTELADRFEDVKVKRVLYRDKDNPKQEFDKFMRDTKAVEKDLGFKTRRFEPRQDRPKALLESYGASEVVIEHLCDNFVNWEGGQIIRGSVRDGPQAQRFLEHCLNNYGGIPPGKPLQGRHLFGDIPFQVKESEEGRKTLNLLVIGVYLTQTQIMLRDVYHIFVDELNGRETSPKDKPIKWYQRLLG